MRARWITSRGSMSRRLLWLDDALESRRERPVVPIAREARMVPWWSSWLERLGGWKANRFSSLLCAEGATRGEAVGGVESGWSMLGCSAVALLSAGTTCGRVRSQMPLLAARRQRLVEGGPAGGRLTWLHVLDRGVWQNRLILLLSLVEH